MPEIRFEAGDQDVAVLDGYCSARGEPTANQLFRENTDKAAGSMANVTRIPSLKRCVCCKRMRTAVTGRETQSGFMCGMCGK